MPDQMNPIQLGRLLQGFFCQRLMKQRGVSLRTIHSYRDTFRLLLRFGEQKLGKKAAKITLSDLKVDLVLAFLDYLEEDRHNCTRSRNARLAAIRSFLHYAALEEPGAMQIFQRVLAIPMKRFDKPLLSFLSLEEIERILEAPDSSTWSGRRDRALFATLYNTGARVSEIVSIKCGDIDGSQCTSLLLHGKGRKERVVPLWKRTGQILRQWLPQINHSSHHFLFPNRFGKPMTRSGVEKQLRSAVIQAGKECPSLFGKKISPHTIRHTTAMHLLQSGVDLSVIAMWLGHESINTTHSYMLADVEMKKRALGKIKEPNTKFVSFNPSDDVLAFLNAL